MDREFLPGMRVKDYTGDLGTVVNTDRDLVRVHWDGAVDFTLHDPDELERINVKKFYEERGNNG